MRCSDAQQRSAASLRDRRLWAGHPPIHPAVCAIDTNLPELNVIVGFLVDLFVARAQRERLAGKLRWLDRPQREAVVDLGAKERIVPENPHSTIVLTDGNTTTCFVIDMSLSPRSVCVRSSGIVFRTLVSCGSRLRSFEI